MSEKLPEWDAQAYHRLGSPQHAWGRKVLDRLVERLRGDETVLDAGCGTGRVTAELLERLPDARVIALDRSPEMLEVAREMLARRFGDRVRFVCADLASLELDAEADAIFSTATLHWVQDHDALFARLLRALRPGAPTGTAWLVAQCGGGQNLARIHARADQHLRHPPLGRFFEGWPEPWYFADAAITARRLKAAGFVDVDTSIEAAPTVLGDAREYGEFLSTVIFGRHLTRVPDPASRERFIHAMVEAGARDDPPYSLDYWRLNMSARRP